MRHLHYLIALLLLSTAASAQTWKKFSDPGIAFTANYPSSWTLKIKEDKRVFFTSPSSGSGDTFLENVNVGVSSSPDYAKKKDIKEDVPEVLQSLREIFEDFNLETERYFTWNNTNSCELIYSGRLKSDNAYVVRLTQWFCYFKGKLYTVTFSAMADTNVHTATARKIMNSIVFK